jgi:hypothetical protein
MAVSAIFVQIVLGQNAPVWAQGEPVVFSVMSDMPDVPGLVETPLFQQYMLDHNRYSPSAFLVHTGDMLKGACTENKYAEVANLLKLLAVPAYIIPGDNEYTDCTNPTQAFGFWKKYFLNFEQNFCGAPATAHPASDPENFAFVMKGVLFVGVSLQGGTPKDSAGWQARQRDDANWVTQQFQSKATQATPVGVRAAVVFGHAGPDSARAVFFNQFRAAAAAFGKSVLYVHGNIHKYLLNKPWPEKNVTRLVVPRGSTEPPLEVTVTMSPENTFMVKRSPWVGALPFNMPPCVNAGADQNLLSDAGAMLKGAVTDDGDSTGALAVTWSKLSGPGAVTFANARALTTNANFGAPGTYVLSLTANDGKLQKSDDIKITVKGVAPALSINDVIINEGNAGTTAALFTVRLSSASASIVTVAYQIVNGTAVTGEDYVANPSSGILSFNGTMMQTIALSIKGDAAVEPNETFFINLSNATNAAIADPQGMGTIINDDIPPPNAPGNLTAIPQGGTNISLIWNDNSTNEIGFKLERKMNGGVFSEIATIGSGANSYNDAGLSAGTMYIYRVRAFTNAALSNYSNETAATTAGGNSNLALKKPISASSTSTASLKPAANAVDGNTATFWRSAGNSSATWLRVDLGALQTIGRVVIKWKDTYYAKSYEIQVAPDTLNWKSAYKTTLGTKSAQNITFPAAMARYVRIFMTKGNKGSYRILEFEVYVGASPSLRKQNESEAAMAAVPDEFVLQQNYPNPFGSEATSPAFGGGNPGTTIGFSLPQATHLNLKVYTITGEEVATLADGNYAAGAHAVIFKPENLPSGTYFYVMQAGEIRKVRRLMLVK